MNKSSGFSNIAIIAIIAVVIIGGGIVWALAQNQSESVDSAVMDNKDKMMSEDKMESNPQTMPEAIKDDKMMDSDGQKAAMTDDAMMKKTGSYKTYSAATVEAEQAAGNKVVLFFHAPWCPFCKTADAAFNSRVNEIPAGVTLLKTDYDSNTELKQKYGVTYQHTFVQIDNNEGQVSKWNGGDIDNLKKYLK